MKKNIYESGSVKEENRCELMTEKAYDVYLCLIIKVVNNKKQ